MSHDKRGDAEAVSAWLRALAHRVETDPAFAAHLKDALSESGLAGAVPVTAPTSQADGKRAKGLKGRKTARNAAPSATPMLDPFGVYRAQGEDGLRAALDLLDLPALRLIVRERRLDPARISARWTARERVTSLIVDQVKARANHGHAFDRV